MDAQLAQRDANQGARERLDIRGRFTVEGFLLGWISLTLLLFAAGLVAVVGD